MTDQTSEFSPNEVDFFIDGVADEALEVAAGSATETANYTLGACTGLSVCPA